MRARRHCEDEPRRRFRSSRPAFAFASDAPNSHPKDPHKRAPKDRFPRLLPPHPTKTHAPHANSRPASDGQRLALRRVGPCGGEEGGVPQDISLVGSVISLVGPHGGGVRWGPMEGRTWGGVSPIIWPSPCPSFWPSPCPSSRAQAQARARPSPCPSSRAQAQARAQAWNAVVSRHWTTPRQTPVQYASGHCSARATNGKQMVGRGPGVQWRGSQSGTCGGRVSGGLQRGGRGGKANAWAHRQACGDAVGTQRGLSAPAHLRRGELVLALCRRQLFAAPEGRGTTRG